MSAPTAAGVGGNVQWRSWSSFESDDAVAELARFVRTGGVVVFPTESSYALGAEPSSAAGVAAVFRIKARLAAKPLPVVTASTEAFDALGIRYGSAGLLGLEEAWPGPLTAVLPCRRGLPAAAGRDELAVRVPGHARLRDLLARAGVALTATSANLAGGEPLLELSRLIELVGAERVLAIDQGRLEGGPPSTLVRLDGETAIVLRVGAIGIETLRGFAPGVRVEVGFSAEPVEIPVEEGA